MRNEFDIDDNLFDDKEDIEFFKELFESQSSKLVLPESLKAENLSKKYAKEIAEIESSDGAFTSEIPTEKKEGKLISLFKKKGLAAIAACVAFASLILFTYDFGENVAREEECVTPQNMTAEAAIETEELSDTALAEGSSQISSAEANDIETKESFYTAVPPPDPGNNMLSSSPAEKNAAPSLDSAVSAERSTDSLPPAKMKSELTGANPSTGVYNMQDAAVFLIFNGADELIEGETIDKVMTDLMDHKHHLQYSNELCSGFIDRLY